MNAYKPFLIQKTAPYHPVRNSMDWSIMIKSVPFKIYPEMKAPAVRKWLDENGDDEFVPDYPVFEAYEMDCEFIFIDKHGMANTSIRDFLHYLSHYGLMNIYDTYTRIGRTNVRYISYSEKALYRRDGENDIVVFSVRFKVNDPITDIYLSI